MTWILPNSGICSLLFTSLDFNLTLKKVLYPTIKYLQFCRYLAP